MITNALPCLLIALAKFHKWLQYLYVSMETDYMICCPNIYSREDIFKYTTSCKEILMNTVAWNFNALLRDGHDIAYQFVAGIYMGTVSELHWHSTRISITILLSTTILFRLYCNCKQAYVIFNMERTHSQKVRLRLKVTYSHTVSVYGIAKPIKYKPDC